jgi:hypothetical protein
MDKRSLISESVVVIQIGVHPVGEEPDQHVVRAVSRVSCMTTVCEVHTKSKSGLCSRDEVLAPSDRPTRPRFSKIGPYAMYYTCNALIPAVMSHL